MSDTSDLAPVVRSAIVERTPADAFRIFTQEIGAWWPLPSHSTFGAASGGVFFQGGRLVEIATDGSEATWGEVIEWDDPHRLVFTWHPGRDASVSSEVEVEFFPDGTGTRVVLEHRGWAAFGAEASKIRRNYIGPSAWGHVLDHLADGSERRHDSKDLAELRQSYDRFFEEAGTKGFDEPQAGGWSAEEVLAHVALNDLSMIAVCQAVVHQTPTRFDNAAGQNPVHLRRWIERHHNVDGLIEAGQRASLQLLAVLARLSAEQQQQPVHCHLTSDGHVMLDDERPWIAIAAEIQATFHLPDHTAQLRQLRSP